MIWNAVAEYGRSFLLFCEGSWGGGLEKIFSMFSGTHEFTNIHSLMDFLGFFKSYNEFLTNYIVYDSRTKADLRVREAERRD